ncbi:hypothetical protein HanHA300_Chr16g0600341 [Helianthus annuus]|nr:hypothetical protein HanHA300_Chr16g0600341 [Helianthus annuus]KAJ0459608.1 hypothetical protein HanHA89_Chr16g0650871 [Helianthus annuus]
MNLMVKFMYIFLVLQAYAIVGSLVVQESSGDHFHFYPSQSFVFLAYDLNLP